MKMGLGVGGGDFYNFNLSTLCAIFQLWIFVRRFPPKFLPSFQIAQPQVRSTFRLNSNPPSNHSLRDGTVDIADGDIQPPVWLYW